MIDHIHSTAAIQSKVLTDVYNQIQEKKDEAIEAHKGRPLFQMPQINIQLPKVELPKIEMPQIRFIRPPKVPDKGALHPSSILIRHFFSALWQTKMGPKPR